MSHVKRGQTPGGKEWVFYVDLGCNAEEVWQSILLQTEMTREEQSALKLGTQGFQAGLRPEDAPWRKPLMSSDPDSVDVYEWWFADRKLTIYNDIDSERYVAVWGTNVYTEMRDGLLKDTSFRTLWKWLHSFEELE